MIRHTFWLKINYIFDEHRHPQSQKNQHSTNNLHFTLNEIISCCQFCIQTGKKMHLVGNQIEFDRYGVILFDSSATTIIIVVGFQIRFHEKNKRILIRLNHDANHKKRILLLYRISSVLSFLHVHYHSDPQLKFRDKRINNRLNGLKCDIKNCE